MRKDYMAVAADQRETDEIDFVSQHWTQIWSEGRGNGPWNRDIESREEWRILAPYLARIDRGASILDGGCGTGAWTLHLASRGFRATGIDISGPTVEQLARSFAGVPFVKGDIRAVPLPDRSFDAYLSLGTFEHFEEGLGPCFREAFRLLKPGGYLFVSVPYHNQRLWLRDRLPLRMTDPGYDADRGYMAPLRFYQWRLTRQELRREFERHGFRVDRVDAIHKSAGIHRLVASDLHIPATRTLHHVLCKALSPVLPKRWVAHMLLAVGVRRTS